MDRQRSSFAVEVLEGGRKEQWMLWGLGSTQGRRPEMEDAHLVNLDLEKSVIENEKDRPDTTTALFGVFDGHGGKEVAAYAARHLASHLVQTQAFKQGDLCSALFDAFVTMDEAMLKDPKVQKELRLLADNAPSGELDALSRSQSTASQGTKPPKAGSTAVVAMVRAGELIIGHAGDSRAMVVDKSGTIKYVTCDHKPNTPSEAERIYAAGGFVTPKRPGAVPRVGGTLALSRALGDSKYKGNEDLSPEEQIVTAAPDTFMLPITKDTHFLVLACDGVWDVLSPEQVVSIVRERMSAGESLGSVALKVVEYTLDHAHGAGPSQDNITFMLATFGDETHGKPGEPKAARC